MNLYAIDYEVNNGGTIRLLNYDRITSYKDLSIHNIHSVINVGYSAISSMCVLLDLDHTFNTVRQTKNHMYYQLLYNELKSILRDEKIDKII